jgi:RimJ/RimL family protein N-acetyltransferase
MEIKGNKISLIPIQEKDKDEFYKLATESYGSKFWYDKRQKKMQSKQEFFKDWKETYFNPDNKEGGQCFWIILNEQRIGQITYNPIDKVNKKVELDIIIGQEENLGKGYGADALRTLIKYLFSNFDINKIWIEARANNQRAIKAYKKAGFKKESLLKQENFFNEEFVDCIRFSILKSEYK